MPFVISSTALDNPLLTPAPALEPRFCVLSFAFRVSSLYRHIPNLITLARLALTVVFFFLLNIHEASPGQLPSEAFTRQMWIAFTCFVVAALTDIVDGYLARRWKVESAFGRVVDPFVDKILICGAFIFFSSDDFINVVQLKDPHLTGIHPWMAVVLIAREFLITSIRGLAESQGINFRADWAGKIKMFTQSFAIGRRPRRSRHRRHRRMGPHRPRHRHLDHRHRHRPLRHHLLPPRPSHHLRRRKKAH